MMDERARGLSEDDPTDDTGGALRSSDEVRPPLHVWRVVEPDDDSAIETAGKEIEGEATAVLADSGAGSDSLTDQEQHPETSTSIRQDAVLLATIVSSALTVNPGATSTLQVKLLNNGDRTALFELLIEGWIDSTWVDVNPVYQELQPGEQALVRIGISPPRRSSSRAGTRQIVAVVRAEDYPGRESRQAATLTILPYDEVALGDISPRIVHTSLRQRDAAFSVPVTNSGNRPIQVRLQGQVANITFDLRNVGVDQSESGPFLAQETIVNLDPGRTTTVQGTLHTERSPLLRRRVGRYRILASVVGKQQVPRAASGQVIQRPWLGPRQLALGAALLLLVIMAISLLGVTGVGLMQIVASLPNAASLPAAPQTAPAPAIALVLPVDDPVPTSDPLASDGAPMAPDEDNATPASAALGTGREASVPLVQPGEVSPPGTEPVSANEAPAAAATAADREALTYAQMFQEIALRYDMDWRLLAAQAYVESKFDTLALGSDGDLGLMQVLPRTWQEWAPVAGVDNPFDAYSNALVAAAYLDYLRSFLGKQGHPETRWMLVAYNWGPDKLETFLADGNTWDDLPQSLQYYATEILRIAGSLSE